jgi:DUF1009 family protein
MAKPAAERIAILAGGGSLPVLVAKAAKDQHKDVFVVALKSIADAQWVETYPHAWIGLAKVGQLFDLLKKENITHLVMAGHVKRPSFGELVPDWTGLKTLYRLQRHHLQGDDAILRFLADEIEKQGITVIGADSMYHDGLMPTGVMTKTQPSNDDWADIHYALPHLQEWALRDQGQAIVVQQKLILGIEAIEGTEELIARCGTYKRKGRAPILLKIKKPQQDRRLDLPTIGVDTIRQAIRAGFAGIAIEAGNAMFLHAPQAVEEANKYGLFIVGLSTEPSADTQQK